MRQVGRRPAFLEELGNGRGGFISFVVIVAREGIAPGGQVLVDYGDAYWRASGVAPRPLPRILADVGTDRYRF